ncbi:hypothetical protein Tco_0671765 [Tanacetum coccineum]
MSYNLFLDHSFGSDATVTKLAFDQILFLTSGGAFGADNMEGLEGSIRRISVLLLMSCNLFLEHSFGSDATVTKLSFDQILFLTSGGAFGTDDIGQKLEKESTQDCLIEIE